MTTLQIRQDAPKDGRYPVRLTLKQHGRPDFEAEANIEFALTEQEQEDIRWYLEDYLQRADIAETVTVEQVEELMKARGTSAMLIRNSPPSAISTPQRRPISAAWI